MAGNTSERALTDEQEQVAARRQGSLLLAAGAGSGKTAVLVERFVRAVREDGVAPGKILAITFTERSAGELRERIRARMLELGERDAAHEAEAAFVGTFHGFCSRLLRAHPLQAGVEPGFRVLEEDFAGRLRVLAFGEALARLLGDGGQEAVDLVAAYGADPLRAMTLGAHAQLRSQGELAPRLPLPDAAEPQLRLIDSLLAGFDAYYLERKRARGALDFDDLELLARELLRGHAGLREAWSGRFDLLMVDEFQDTNPRQLQILAALDRDNLFTVGDELQSIYSFRHADVSLFRERRDLLARQGSSLALTRSFRSRPAILAAVGLIFAGRMGERFAPLAAAREQPPDGEPRVELLLTDRRGWERSALDPALTGLPEATAWRQAEARALASRLHELVDADDVRPGEVAVLLRALGDLPVYEAALRERGLATSAGIGGFWSHQQVADLLAWLRCLANPLDEPALYSALASPLFGLSSDGLALLAGVARGQGLGPWQAIAERREQLDAVLTEPDRSRLAAFGELLGAERAAAPLLPISDLLRRALLATGYERHVRSLHWGERRLTNVHKLLRLARSFEAQEGRDLRRFLDHAAYVESAPNGREGEAVAQDGDAVRLMSIHAAKGLEFPVVCVVDLGREPNLRQPDLLVDGAGGRVGLRVAGLREPEPVVTHDYDQLRDERRQAQEEEEDRILYVACTRAQERLILSGAVSFARWPAPRPGVAPVAWLAPALVPDSPSLAGSEAPPVEPVVVDLGEGLRVRCVFNSAAAAGDPSAGDDERPREAGKQADSAQASPGPAEQLSLSLGSQSAPIPTSASVFPFAKTRRSGRVLPAQPQAPRKTDPTPEPVPLADPDGTISYSSLAELERCGYRFYAERVLRLPERRVVAPEGDDGGLEARVRGTIAHALLERVDFACPRPPGSREVAEAAQRIGARVSVEQREEIVALLAGALAAEPARLLAETRAVRREHPFAFALDPEEPLVTGFIDLIGHRPGRGTLIVDYKSDRLRDEDDLEALVERDYAVQRLVYALAAIEGGAKQVEVVHWFLQRPRRWVAASFGSHEREALRARLSERLAAARERGFSVAEDPHRGICLTCPARGGLCSWGETHTLRERSATLATPR